MADKQKPRQKSKQVPAQPPVEQPIQKPTAENLAPPPSGKSRKQKDKQKRR